jgi:hypothetical protein
LAKQHYVSNKDFYQAFLNYLPVVRPLREKHNKEMAKLLAKGIKKRDLPKFARPQTPDYDFIGECLWKIATHLAFKPNFTKYTFKEEMIGDAIENAVTYLENFDPEKTNNPFAYFTQIMTYAFLRRIAKEEKDSYIKQKILEDPSGAYFSTQDSDVNTYHNTYVDFIKDVKSDVTKDFEEKKARKKKANLKVKAPADPGIDRFLISVQDEA